MIFHKKIYYLQLAFIKYFVTDLASKFHKIIPHLWWQRWNKKKLTTRIYQTILIPGSTDGTTYRNQSLTTASFLSLISK